MFILLSGKPWEILEVVGGRQGALIQASFTEETIETPGY